MRRELIENLLATTPYDEVEFDSPAYKWLKAVVELLNDARSCTEAKQPESKPYHIYEHCKYTDAIVDAPFRERGSTLSGAALSTSTAGPIGPTRAGTLQKADWRSLSTG